jgi:hypothetical protein
MDVHGVLKLMMPWALGTSRLVICIWAILNYDPERDTTDDPETLSH